MIPRAFVTEWQSRAPWPQPYQVEQDLILSRLMIEIADHELLGGELVMRGGTCLHKLHLPQPRRYSEDLDYVRRTHSGIKPHVDALREIAGGIGLEVASTGRSGAMVHVVLDAEPAVTPGRIRIKIETNIEETKPYAGTIAVPHKIESRWWAGEADVPTYELEELMSTKLRALYQRDKGRDLFDLWLVLSERQHDPRRIVAGLHHYMGAGAFTYPQLSQNLRDKLGNAGFRADLDALVSDSQTGYDVEAAAELVMEQLGSLLANAPALAEIAGGAWR